MIRVEAKNFQSIAEETVEISGFSVVVGRSNIGKSALVRAVKAALTGAPADNYIRHEPTCPRAVKGAKTCKCFCSVRIVAPGFDLLWEKGDSVNRYVYNGTEHTVVGRGTPEFLGASFAPIYIGGDSQPTLLQVADQFRPLFILDRSGTAVADVLSDVAKLDQINDAARAAEKDKRECASARKLRGKDLKEIEHTLEAYAGLDAVIARVREVEEMGRSVQVLEEHAEKLQRSASELTRCMTAIRALQPIERIEMPSITSVVGKAEQSKGLTRWQGLLKIKSDASVLWERVVALPTPEIVPVERSYAALIQLVKWSRQLVAIKTVFADLKAAEAVSAPDLSGIAKLQNEHRRLSNWAARYSDAVALVLRLENAVAKAQHEESIVLAEFKSLEVCPTCRQPVPGVAHTHLGAA